MIFAQMRGVYLFLEVYNLKYFMQIWIEEQVMRMTYHAYLASVFS